MPSARVYATAIVGFVTLAANGIVLALHCAKGTTRSRKNDVVVGANVLMDMLQSSRNVLFGVYVLGVYAQFSYVPVIRNVECLGVFHSVIDMLIMPLQSAILFTTAIERFYCVVHRDRYAYQGASSIALIQICALFLAIPAIIIVLATVISSGQSSFQMVRAECFASSWMDRTVYVGLYLQGAVLSALSIFLYTLTFRKLREIPRTATTSRDREKRIVTLAMATVLVTYVLFTLVPEFIVLSQSQPEFRDKAEWLKLSRSVLDSVVYVFLSCKTARQNFRTLLYWKKTASTSIIMIVERSRQ
ncbi:hypothetical protein AAVH_08098 [Aphelenchoides avenae]|nr:hypothetical protein AAVH_08098 [Aphelenchus avenae]